MRVLLQPGIASSVGDQDTQNLNVTMIDSPLGQIDRWRKHFSDSLYQCRTGMV